MKRLCKAIIVVCTCCFMCFKVYGVSASNEITPQSTFVASPLDTIVITSDYGYRRDPFDGKRKFHNGVDLKCSSNNVYSMLNGKVKKVGYDKISGKYIIIDSGNFTISYCHLSEILVTLNSYVTAGNKIGVTGNTGRSTGEHLHLKCTYKGEIINPVVLFRFIRAY